MAIITIPIEYIDGVDVVRGQDITDTQETAIDAREKALRAIVSVSLDDTTGIFTFTRASGATFTLDTLLEKVATNFYYDTTTQELVLVLEDGTEQRIPMTAFIDDYSGNDGDMITISISNNNVISAVIKAGTVTLDRLTASLQASINAIVDKLSKTGGTMTGALTMSNGSTTVASIDTNGYVTGTWLRTTGNIALGSAPSLYAVISNGWIYTRTLAQTKSDLGIDQFIKSASVANNVLTLTDNNGNTVTFQGGGGGSTTTIRRWS